MTFATHRYLVFNHRPDWVTIGRAIPELQLAYLPILTPFTPHALPARLPPPPHGSNPGEVIFIELIYPSVKIEKKPGYIVLEILALKESPGRPAGRQLISRFVRY